jgi:hypothetical protein
MVSLYAFWYIYFSFAANGRRLLGKTEGDAEEGSNIAVIQHGLLFKLSATYNESDKKIIVKKYVYKTACMLTSRQHTTGQVYILYFSILLHSFNTEYLFFCPSM